MNQQHMMILYQLEQCPECKLVREALCAAQATYVAICVPKDKTNRGNLMAASGQVSVPTLVDGTTVLTTLESITTHIRQRFTAGPSASLS